jgi:hypothetical protein
LLVGPFASERHNTYLPWVRWARYLAKRNIEALRFDYRGIGESTGQFDGTSFADWGSDLNLLCDWFAAHSPQAPFFLHGLALGALLAARAFHQGSGDGLLLWSPPADANQALRATLKRWIGLDQIFKFGSDRRSAADSIRALELGISIEVEGYRWSTQLWQESFNLALPSALADEETAAAAYDRPVKITRLTSAAAPLAKGGSVGYDDLKDFTWLFAPHVEWIVQAAAQSSKAVTYADAD